MRMWNLYAMNLLKNWPAHFLFYVSVTTYVKWGWLCLIQRVDIWGKYDDILEAHTKYLANWEYLINGGFLFLSKIKWYVGKWTSKRPKNMRYRKNGREKPVWPLVTLWKEVTKQNGLFCTQCHLPTWPCSLLVYYFDSYWYICCEKSSHSGES